MASAQLPTILKSPQSQAVYRKLLPVFRGLGRVEVEEKKSSLHVTNGRAFAGVHPRADGLILNLVLDQPLRHARVHKCEQVSAHRYHVEFKLEGVEAVDSKLSGWIEAAYALTQ